MVGVPGADFTAGTGPGPGNLDVDNTGGTVCYTDSAITQQPRLRRLQGHHEPSHRPGGANFGSPFALPGMNLDGQSLIRTISRGCPTALDTADDTNSAADFTVGTGTPRGNSVAPTETLCAPAPATKKKCKKHKKSSGGAYSAKKPRSARKRRSTTNSAHSAKEEASATSGSSYAPACWSFSSSPLTPSEPSTRIRFSVNISLSSARPSSVVVAPR